MKPLDRAEVEKCAPLGPDGFTDRVLAILDERDRLVQQLAENPPSLLHASIDALTAERDSLAQQLEELKAEILKVSQALNDYVRAALRGGG